MRLSLVPIFVFLMPLAEIAGFIVVGKMLGVWATLALVILSAVLGAALLRIQGIGILQRISAESRNGGDPGREMVHGAMIVIAAFFLMLPGFISDIIGLLLFIPAVRELAWKVLRKRIVVLGSTRAFRRGPGQGSSPNTAPGPQPRPSGSGRVVDLDETDFHREPDRNSPWSDRKRLEE
ncbi:membrane protein FxsA [Agrobacterium sp. SHOUNA12C]|uniref:FxsA protein n=1 Tax=Rhizobium rhizogenes NBRC 13257 TaxID=1220581 RepID=A0AA87U744_RHIRH|nr:FxsA family protein [Rhizobium rhizogenes]MCJ9722785.1 membrane protein FxsA [Agrobacterium sp. BETTINA12B]MCJ9757928.1 membrane protein FxsA [Agrobacterium sp. SHOUNA12C]OCJ29899.1 membrane protein FxsA [Agrobacterium sp. B133/95]KEA04649.1 exclusion suppressor FxsA [Rhizobium rhizogenes]MQB33888.1 membrane protein FxsA [Rhizobium rhizogenes]